jgi:DNA repair exonuclease SbcCD nuclease subunit
MRPCDPVVAIACADIHLSLAAPPARSREKDWFAAMTRPLEELRLLAKAYQAPILCAGDIFDRWNSPPELINFALEHLPPMYAVAGQHDQPLHNMADIKRSAFWTLVEAGRVTVAENPGTMIKKDVFLVGFPYGEPVRATRVDAPNLKIALVHEYVWMHGFSYPGAVDGFLGKEVPPRFAGYNVVITGDNHKGFSICYKTKGQPCSLFNCGSLMRRKSDEIVYRPQVGLVRRSGYVNIHMLACSDDLIDATDKPEEPLENPELKAFLSELITLENAALDFAEAVRRTIKRTKPIEAVRRLLLDAMEQR